MYHKQIRKKSSNIKEKLYKERAKNNQLLNIIIAQNSNNNKTVTSNMDHLVTLNKQLMKLLADKKIIAEYFK